MDGVDTQDRMPDTALFRRVMGSFATGVTVITARDGAGFRGMTANAFMSGSLEPPLCVVAVAARAHMHALLMRAGRFGVSILAAHQEAVSAHFAGRAAPDFVPDVDLTGPAPLLRETCATIAAEVDARHACGDHTLFIGRVVALTASDRPPLVYHASRYAGLTERVSGDVDLPELL